MPAVPSGTPVRSGLAVLGAVALLCTLWATLAGRVWTWDRAHYHAYAGLLWLDGRLGQGFLPAGGQTFLNPLSYVPAAILGRAGVPESAIAALHAALHSLNVWLVWLVARACVAPGEARTRALPLVAAVLAGVTPVFVLEVGTSYADVSTSVGVLLGAWCCLKAAQSGGRSARWIVAGGVAMGAMAGLKLSNALPAALGALLLTGALADAREVVDHAAPAVQVRRTLLRWAAYGSACLLGFALAHGGWSAQLYRVTGNPVYPHLAGLFEPVVSSASRSAPAAEDASSKSLAVPVPVPVPAPAPAPDASGQAPIGRVLDRLRIAGRRFTPDAPLEWLTLPLRIADPRFGAPQAYLEARFPDPRLAVLGLLVLALLARRALRAAGALPAPAVSPPATAAAAAAVAGARRLHVFLAVWYVAWTLTSANGRYGLPLLMLLSVPIAIAAFLLFHDGRARIYGLAGLLALHVGWTALATDHALGPGDRDWVMSEFRADVPASIRDAPWLHVSTSIFSWSYLMPALHPQSALANLGGVCDTCTGPAGRVAAQAVLQQWSGRVRLIAPVDRVDDGRPTASDAMINGLDAMLAEYDLRVDADSCEPFQATPNGWGGMLTETRGATTVYRASDWLLSCRLVEDPGLATATRAVARRYDPVFLALERACPSELGRPRGATGWDGSQAWIRRYDLNEITVSLSRDHLHASTRLGARRAIGAADTIAGAAVPVDCGLLRWEKGEGPSREFDPAMFSGSR
jgi:hypothetical protein